MSEFAIGAVFVRLRCLLTGSPLVTKQLGGDKAAASVTCVPGKSPAAPVARLAHGVSTLGVSRQK